MYGGIGQMYPEVQLFLEGDRAMFSVSDKLLLRKIEERTVFGNWVYHSIVQSWPGPGLRLRDSEFEKTYEIPSQEMK